MKYILAYDIGTTGIKSCLFDENLELKGSRYRTYQTYYPGPLKALQSPEDWWLALSESTREIMWELNISASSIACISVDGHMNGCIPVGPDGELLLEQVFIWADFRSTEEAAFIDSEIGYERFYHITGGGLDLPVYPAAKILWIKNNLREVYNKAHYFLGTKDYINLKLTGTFSTDYSDGSNYGLMNLREKSWSRELTDALKIDIGKLPPLKASCDTAGLLTKEAAAACGLIPGIPVITGGGDVPCASVGAGSWREGISYINIGSASWISRTVSGESLDFDPKNRPFLICTVVDGLYASQLVNYGGGICYQWIIDTLASAASGDDNAETVKSKLYADAEKQKQDESKFAHNLLFLPYLRGGGAPEYNENARGAFVGLSLEHDAFDMINAVQAGVAYNLRRMFPLLFRKASEPSEVRIIGGGARSDNWCQIISDICGLSVVRPDTLQTATARGAAVVGGIGIGLFSDFSVAESSFLNARSFIPDRSIAAHHEKMYGIFLALLKSLGLYYNELAG